MNQNEFNPIGIDSQLDWPRIRKLLSIGLFAAILTLIGDMMIGWGIQDETKKGLVRMFSPTGTQRTAHYLQRHCLECSVYFWKACLTLEFIVLWQKGHRSKHITSERELSGILCLDHVDFMCRSV